MGIKQKIFSIVARQFRRPSGFFGWLAGWEMALNRGNRKRNAWAVSLVDPRADARVLEIGFGPGIAVRELAKRVTAGKVYGVDHSETMRRFASKRNTEAVAAGRVDLRVGSADDLPEFGERFDLVLTVNSLQFWPEPTERLKEIRRLLGTAGRIAIVSQPRCPGATADTTKVTAEEIVQRLAESGYTVVCRETLDLSPPAVCVIGAV
ncbi:MAG: class I SAM-dependent methyltransferase [Actinomycetota bacterium]